MSTKADVPDGAGRSGSNNCPTAPAFRFRPRQLRVYAMRTVPDKSQQPQQQNASVCAKCGGSGRVQVTVKGAQTSQPCFACRGTGQGSKGYGTK